MERGEEWGGERRGQGRGGRGEKGGRERRGEQGCRRGPERGKRLIPPDDVTSWGRLLPDAAMGIKQRLCNGDKVSPDCAGSGLTWGSHGEAGRMHVSVPRDSRYICAQAAERTFFCS
ncbi:hypothetical protein CBR_g26434 [Chara braunii]|uniref:Uncharacterized protein n=1 Tax=Chara braunii TaxID=69332 RepID=A0A388L7X9_CHABU|nr:hypothetical protein CBR_g26434 [Chara braunii]|eukprot:GBG78406.1 hypothetical protein CBR_g26434 [Chara braunii]